MKAAEMCGTFINCQLSIYLIFPAALGPGVHSAANTNEYQKKQKTNSVAFTPRENYTDRGPPLVDEI
jgi:hypothetical protein